jgi:hypothetical protein
MNANTAGEIINGNTLNVAIIAAVAVFAIIMVFRYLRRGGKLKAGGVEIGGTPVGVPIQRIDDTCKLKCREALNGMRESVLAELPSDDRIVCEALVDRILSPLYTSITRNHFTRTFSEEKKNTVWTERILDDINRNIRSLEYRCGVKWPELHTPEFNEYLRSLIGRCRGLFIDPVIEGSYAKIEVYQRSGGENAKEWIERNEAYIKALKNN